MDKKLFLLFSRNIGKVYNDFRDELCEVFNLKRIEIDILGFLNNYPELDTASDIVNMRSLAKSNVSQALEWLEAKDYIVTAKDTIDKRKIHIKLTDEARRITSRIEKMQDKYMDTILKNFSYEDKVKFKHFITKINENLSELV